LQNNAELGGAIYITSDDDFYFSRKWVTWASWKKLS
jgi:predicted outer membrane repeat protein